MFLRVNMLPAPLSTGTWQNVHKKLDEEIAAYKECIRTVKTRRNAATPICQLPTYILSITFEVLVLMSFEDMDLRWIQVTHVCQHWRSVALAYPRLWSYIAFPPSYMARTMLYRSKSTLLHLKCKNLDHGSGILDEGLRQAWRIKELHISMQPASHSAYSFVLLRGPFPCLETFSLHIPVDTILDADIPDNLFGGIAPRLRHLTLLNCTFFSWNPSILASITTLSISYYETYRISLQALLTALTAMSQLETLFVCSIATHSSPGISQHNKQIAYLPHLTSIWIRANFHTCHLFQALAYPNLTFLGFCCIIDAETSEEYSSISYIFSSLDQSMIPLYDIQIDIPKHAFQILAAHRQSYVHISIGGEDLNWNRLVVKLCESLPLALTKRLNVKGIQDLGSSDWMKIFGRMAKLEELLTDSPQALISVLSALLNNNINWDHMKPPSVLVPTLRELRISLRDLGEDNVQFIEDLKETIRSRAEHGHGIEELVLKGCYRISKDDIRGLKKYTRVKVYGRSSERLDKESDCN